MVSTMPAADPSRDKRDPRLPTVVFWSGVGLAPLALLIMVVGRSSGAIEVALALGLISIVLIGVSMALRRDSSSLKSEVEELVYDEIDTLRDDIREDISHAARATHKSLADRIVHLSETVDVLRGQVDTMRDQVDRVTTPAVAPHPTGVGHVPGGVLRHTETVQVTTRQTMLVDPHDTHRDGTVYGNRPGDFVPRQPGFTPQPADQGYREQDRPWQPADDRARAAARPGALRPDDPRRAAAFRPDDERQSGVLRPDDERRSGAFGADDGRRSGALGPDDVRRAGLARPDDERRSGPGRARVEGGGPQMVGPGRARVDAVPARFDQGAPAAGRVAPGRGGVDQEPRPGEQGVPGRARVGEPSRLDADQGRPGRARVIEPDPVDSDRRPQAALGGTYGSTPRADHGSTARAGYGPADRAEYGPATRAAHGSGAEHGAAARADNGPGARAERGSAARVEHGSAARGDFRATADSRDDRDDDPADERHGDISGVLQRGNAGNGPQRRAGGLADVFQRRAEPGTSGTGWQSDPGQAPLIPQQRRAPALEATSSEESWSEQMLRERLNRPDDRDRVPRRTDDPERVPRRTDDHERASRRADDGERVARRTDDNPVGRRRAAPEPEDQPGRRRRDEPAGSDAWRDRIEESPSGNAWSRRAADDHDGSGEWTPGRRRAQDDSYESASGRVLDPQGGHRRARDDHDTPRGYEPDPPRGYQAAPPRGYEADDPGRRRAPEDGYERDVPEVGRRRAYDVEDVAGVRTTDRWASVRSDDRGARELRMGERRSAVHEDATGSELRIEDRWATVREEPAIESPRRSQARQDRESQDRESQDRDRQDRDRAWGPETRWEDDGSGSWRQGSTPALPAAPQGDDDGYAWNHAVSDRSASSHRLVDFEEDDDRWR